MKRIVICIALLFTCLLHAQTQLDSLYNIWLDDTKPDSTRVISLTAYINDKYLYNQPDSVLIIVESLEKFSRKKNYDLGLLYASKIKGAYYFQVADYPNAIKYIEESLEYSKVLDRKRDIGGNLNNLGNILASQGNYMSAINYYEASLIAYENADFKDGISSTLHNIGTLYVDQGELEKALEYYENSLVLSRETGDAFGISHATGNIGSVYEELGNTDKALRYFEESLKINRDIGDLSGVAFSLYSIGGIYVGLNENSKAKEYFEESLKVSTSIDDKREMMAALIMMGNNYESMGEHNKALEKCLLALELAQSVGDLLKQKDCNECIYKAYKAIGNAQRALYYLELDKVLNDSLNEVETAKKIQRFEFDRERLTDSLQNEESKLKIEMAHQAEVRKKDKNRNIALGAGLFFLLVSGGLYSRYRYTKNAKAVIEKEKDRSENLLLNILPAEVAEELKEKGETEAQDFETVSILFSDFKGFTGLSEKMSAKDLVANINECFKAFDDDYGDSIKLKR